MIKHNRGVSLIVLVITVIIIAILAGASIATLNNNNILDTSKEVVDDTNLYQAQQVANIIWTQARLDNIENITEEYIKEKLKTNEVDADRYDITIFENGVKLSIKGEGGTDEPEQPGNPSTPTVPIPDSWKASVSEVTEDGVPIPKGFVKSPYEGETEKNQGLVIYALTTAEIANGQTDIKTIDKTKQVSLENRNQFVWVPVDSSKFSELFVRDNFGKGYKISNTVGSSDVWEIALDSNNMPLANQGDNNQYISKTTLAEATAMYASVKKYGGFYMARYEAGGNETYKHPNWGYLGRGYISVTMGKYPYGESCWGATMADEVLDGGAVTISRSLYPANGTDYGAVSTLVYGVQWSRTVKWFQEMNPSMTLAKNTEYALNTKTEVLESDLNENALCSKWTGSGFGEWHVEKNKPAGESWLFTTGAYKKASVCNIYDMAGSLWEWTMEGVSTNKHLLRGDTFKLEGSSLIEYGGVDVLGAYRDFGFRPALYIK